MSTDQGRQKKYLAQLYNISPDYAQGVYDKVFGEAKTKYTMDEVKELSETAHLWYREKKFLPLNGEKLTGFAAPGAYNTA